MELIQQHYEGVSANGENQMSACVYHYAASRSEKNFTRPDDFVPERWLENPPAEFANDNRAVVQPFHVGPRACLGKP